MNQVWLAFITGLTTGGISCFAVQGGLLASSMTQNGEVVNKKYVKVGVFITTKIIAYTLLGILLGLLGSAFIISPKILGFMQILAGVFMLATVGRLLELHPIFNKFVIHPPKWAFRIVRNQSKNAYAFAPGVLGFLTVLIPCGITQAMMLLAISSGNPVSAAGIMFAFVLGTSPVFFLMGLTLSQIMQKKALVYASSAIILVLGIMSINTGQALRGSSHTLQNYYKVLVGQVTTSSEAGTKGIKVNSQGSQEVTINVLSSKYVSDTQTLKVGVPVELKLATNNTQGCIRSFTIPQYNISKILPATGTETIKFTPTKTGLLTYTCGMGMYTGSFTVVN